MAAPKGCRGRPESPRPAPAGAESPSSRRLKKAFFVLKHDLSRRGFRRLRAATKGLSDRPLETFGGSFRIKEFVIAIVSLEYLFTAVRMKNRILNRPSVRDAPAGSQGLRSCFTEGGLQGLRPCFTP